MKPSFSNLKKYLTMYQTINSPLEGRYNPEFWSVRETYRCIIECNAADQEFGAPNSDEFAVLKWRLKFPRIAAALDVAWGIAQHLMCDLFGHHYEDLGSYANEESAAEHFACSRCGDSFHHTYY